MVVEWQLNGSRMGMIYHRYRHYYTIPASVVGSWSMDYSPLYRHSFYTGQNCCTYNNTPSSKLSIILRMVWMIEPYYFAATFTRAFTHTLVNLTGFAIYSTRGRFCFHHGQNRKLNALPPPSAIKMTSSCALAIT